MLTARLRAASDLIIALILALSSVAISYVCNRLAYTAGHNVGPTLATILGICHVWILIITAIIIILPWKGRTGRSYLVRALLSAACLSPFFIPGFTINMGFRGFIERMHEDIRPRELSSWLKSRRPSTDNPFEQIQVTASEWDVFGKSNVTYSLPVLEFGPNGAMIKWGSDFQTWAILLPTDGVNGDTWQDGLHFRWMQK